MAVIFFVNGEFTTEAENATINARDRGNIFGDGVYEVIRTYNKKPFLFEEHLERLARSAREIRLDLTKLPWSVKDSILEANLRSGYDNARIYIQISRGAGPRNHLFINATPSLIVIVEELVPLSDNIYKNGVDTIIVPDMRWRRCDIKSLNLLANVLAKQQAHESGAFEAILNRDGYIVEGSASNLFMVKNGQIKTPPADTRILRGVTRMAVIEICSELSRSETAISRVVEKDITEEEFLDADEIFLTGTTIELVPVTKVNGRPFKTGKVFSILNNRWKHEKA